MGEAAEPRDWSKIVTPKPALQLVAGEGPGFTKFGGCPDVPPGFAWPLRAEREASGYGSPFGVLWAKITRRERPKEPERPLAFVAQIDLAEVAKHRQPDFSDCPSHGALYFFFNEDECPWGVHPPIVTTNSWRVVYIEDSDAVRPLPAPSGPGKPPHVYQERFLSLRPFTSWPLDPESDAALDKANLNEGEQEEYGEFTNTAFEGKPAHQLFGFAEPVQDNAMEAECRSDAFRDSTAKEAANSRDRWRLLLQIDSDDHFCWGDAGKLYFWIREEDLRRRCFDRVWLIMQCG